MENEIAKTIIERNAQTIFGDPFSRVFQGIIVEDGICGIGKTTEALNYINELLNTNPDARMIYATPYLDETHRIAGTTAEVGKTGKPLKSKRPKRDDNGKIIYESYPTGHKFYHPENRGISKLEHFKKHLRYKRNIVITHSLLHQIDSETIQLLKDNTYHLVIDEEPVVIELASDHYDPELTKQEVVSFFKDGLLSVDLSTDIVSWNDDGGKRYYKRYSDVQGDCDNKRLIRYSAKGDPVLLWRENPEVFTCFKTVRLLTYQFKGTTFNAYLDFYKLPYLINNRTQREIYSNSRIRPYHQLIQLYKPKGNWYKQDGSKYSSSWFDSHKDVSDPEFLALRKRLATFFKRAYPHSMGKTKISHSHKLWTTYKKCKSKLRQPGFTYGFVSFNTKATNKYKDRIKLAYLLNYFSNPLPQQYFSMRGVSIDQDAISLNELLQWLFRSALRDGKMVHVFIASTRMTTLLENWMKEYQIHYDSSREVLDDKVTWDTNSTLSQFSKLDFETWLKNEQPGLTDYYKTLNLPLLIQEFIKVDSGCTTTRS